tara:strand:- start:1210 stop:1638 length:429 start_codon:yes stop_codon:yes gene_type:complete
MKLFKNIIILLLLINIKNVSYADKDFLTEGKNFFNNKKYEDAKFKFEQDIVFNPKSEESYLYLSKIFNIKEEIEREENNLNTVLLLNPKNEDAVYSLAILNIKKSNFSEAKSLIGNLNNVCKKMCFRVEELNNKLGNLLKSK